MSESLKHKPDDIAGLVGWLNAAEAFLLDAAGYERNEIPYRSAEACKNAAAALEQQAEDIAELEAEVGRLRTGIEDAMHQCEGVGMTSYQMHDILWRLLTGGGE